MVINPAKEFFYIFSFMYMRCIPFLIIIVVLQRETVTKEILPRSALYPRDRINFLYFTKLFIPAAMLSSTV